MRMATRTMEGTAAKAIQTTTCNTNTNKQKIRDLEQHDATNDKQPESQLQ